MGLSSRWLWIRTATCTQAVVFRRQARPPLQPLTWPCGTAASGRRLKPLHWVLWVLLGIGPIGLDGFSQLFSQMNWAWLSAIIPYRESTPLLRVLTGGLFGFATAGFAFPYMEESMAETRQFFIKKFAAIKQNNLSSAS